MWAHNTELGYSYDWRNFRRWCEGCGREPLPASVETVTLYLTDQLVSGKKVSTVTRRAAALAHMHKTGGVEWIAATAVRYLLEAAQRARRERPRQMAPLSLDHLREIAAMLGRDGTPDALRDRAVLVVGFGSALRRSSLVALLTTDVEFVPSGLIVNVRHEKQDQGGKGRLVGLPAGACADTCPVRCLRAWLEVRQGSTPGPLFTNRGRGMRPDAVARIVKRSVERLGLDSSEYAGHSLRAGFVTAAGEAGAGELVIAAQTGHRSMDVLRRYFRRRDLWRANACAMLGL